MSAEWTDERMGNTPTLSSPRQSGSAAWESGALWGKRKKWGESPEPKRR